MDRLVDRLVGWYRLGSSRGAVAALIAANAIPLVGVLFLGWSVWAVLIVYWLENGIVGLFNVLKMARAEGPQPVVAPARAGGPTGRTAGRLALIPFFLVHYGLFWVVHGTFVMTMPAFTGAFRSIPGAIPDEPIPVFGSDGDPFVWLGAPEGSGLTAGLDSGALVLAVVALALSHGLSFWWNFLRGGEYRRVTPERQMGAPYGRLFALHLTIILGAMAIVATGAPAAAVAVLVAAKIALDVGLHVNEHRRIATRPATPVASTVAPAS